MEEKTPVVKPKYLILKIDDFRIKRGLSKNKLAIKVNMQFTACATFCNNTNKSDPTIPILARFAKVFNCQIKDLFEEILID